MELLTEYIKKSLEDEALKRNSESEISEDKPDPLLIAKNAPDDRMALFCALFAYGSAKQIYKFLKKIDLNILDYSESEIIDYVNSNNLYYRFQNSNDISNFLIILKNIESVEKIFYESYKENNSIFDGIVKTIEFFHSKVKNSSDGIQFLIGTPKQSKKEASPYKRWNLFLRWMVRKDSLDLGWWRNIDKKDLIIPLDTHVFRTAQKLGWLKSTKANFQAAEDVTNILKELDPNDPVKYDMAIYRLGQESSDILFN
ncbi:TIGR02757 family protein [bacterium]|nr:TIGR02757 family protein [bacterium]